MKKKTTVLLAILFIGFVSVAINDLRHNQISLRLNEIRLQDNVLELRKVELEKKQLNEKFNEAVKSDTVNQEKVRQLEQEKLELEEKARKLEADLQARAESNARKATVAHVGITEKASAMVGQVSVSGTKYDWLNASGIPSEDWWAVDWIVSRESSWNPCAYNPGQSDCSANPKSACGLVQQYPCGKIGGSWTDPVAALKWQAVYVCADKFSGYAGATCYERAVSYWKIHGNY